MCVHFSLVFLGGGTGGFVIPITGPVPEPSKFEPINFQKAKALRRSGSLPKFDFPSLMDTPELLPVTPRLVHSSEHHHQSDEVREDGPLFQLLSLTNSSVTNK